MDFSILAFISQSIERCYVTIIEDVGEAAFDVLCCLKKMWTILSILCRIYLKKIKFTAASFAASLGTMRTVIVKIGNVIIIQRSSY